MLRLVDDSKWAWNTSANVSLSVLFAVASAGYFVLDRPGGGPVRFNYLDTGASFGKSLSPVGLSFATSSDFSTGKIFGTELTRGHELTDSDIEGACLALDIGAVGTVGKTGTILLLGIPFERLADEVSNTLTLASLGVLGAILADSLQDWAEKQGNAGAQLFQSSARAVLMMGGDAHGTPGFGIAGSIGGVMRTGQDVPILDSISTGRERPY